MLDNAAPGADIDEAPLPTSPDALLARLAELGIPYEEIRHAAYRTVEDAQTMRGDVPGGHCKNLFLKDKKGRFWLIVALEEAEIRLNQFDKVIGSARLTFASSEKLWEILGVRPGSVTPFALVNDRERVVTPVLQKRMLEQDPLHYHPLVNTRTAAISADDLLTFVRACGHEPMIVDFG